MLGTIATVSSVAAGIVGHVKSKNFVSRKLRFTKVVERPRLGLGVATGCATALVAVPAVAILPFVGLGAAMVFGAGAGIGVGTGVARGAKEARGE